MGIGKELPGRPSKWAVLFLYYPHEDTQFLSLVSNQTAVIQTLLYLILALSLLLNPFILSYLLKEQETGD